MPKNWSKGSSVFSSAPLYRCMEQEMTILLVGYLGIIFQYATLKNIGFCDFAEILHDSPDFVIVLKRSHRILVSSLARNSARLWGQLVCTNEHRTLHSVHMAVHVDRGVVKYFTTPWSIESPVPRKVKIMTLELTIVVALAALVDSTDVLFRIC